MNALNILPVPADSWSPTLATACPSIRTTNFGVHLLCKLKRIFRESFITSERFRVM